MKRAERGIRYVVVAVVLLTTAGLVGVTGSLRAARAAGPDTASGPTVSSAVTHGFLQQLCAATPEPAPSAPPAASTSVAATMPAPSVSFDGTPAAPNAPAPFDSFPADPSGAVGPSDYMQSANFGMTIFAKNGTPRCPTMSSAAFWQPLGEPCYDAWSDEVVLYDRDAGRWFASRFAVVGDADQSEEEEDTTTTAPPAPVTSYQCFAVSTTSDPTKSWQLYVFKVSDTYFGDYPKFGIWPNAYFMSANANKIFSRTGVIAVAFDRQAMLAGEPSPRMVEFFVPANGRKFGMLPADRDGPRPPPAGSPGTFVEPRDTHLGFDAPGLGIWSFAVNWSNPGASTFTASVLPTQPFDSNICGGSQECIPQPATTDKLDSLAYGYLMYRAAYRNFGDHEAIVLNQTVDAGGRAGIRWYELDRRGGGWGIGQQSTYAPDRTSRWMGSMAMDGAGDIVLGFTESDAAALFPSLRAVGRLASDPTNQLPRAETTLISGGGGRTDGEPMWSDWSQMTVDPVDDCTLWHTGQYVSSPADAAKNSWRTRVGAYRFASCGATPAPPAVVPVGSPTGAEAAPSAIARSGLPATGRSPRWWLCGVALLAAGLLLIALRGRRASPR